MKQMLCGTLLFGLFIHSFSVNGSLESSLAALEHSLQEVRKLLPLVEVAPEEPIKEPAAKERVVSKIDDMTYAIGTKTIKLLIGDMTQQRGIDVIVNAANTSITTIAGGGTAAAIYKKMTDDQRKSFAREIEQTYGTKRGVVGGAYIAKLEPDSTLNALGYRYALNAVGPACNSGDDIKLVANAYSNGLIETAKVNARSILFPRISSGIFGCNGEELDVLAVNAVVGYLMNNQSSSIDTVYFIFYSGSNADLAALEHYKELLGLHVGTWEKRDD